MEPIVSLVFAPLGGTNGQGVLGKRVGHNSLQVVVGTPPATLGYIITLVWGVMCVCEPRRYTINVWSVCVLGNVYMSWAMCACHLAGFMGISVGMWGVYGWVPGDLVCF